MKKASAAAEKELKWRAWAAILRQVDWSFLFLIHKNAQSNVSIFRGQLIVN